MNRLLTGTLAVIGAVLAASPATAELPTGAAAPVFVTQGALAGKEFTFDLSRALRRGPVVLYFYPKSFSSGCTIEAHAFAEASKQFRAAGATLIGLSADTIATQKDFSRKDCRDQFPVGVATPAIITGYDVHLKQPDGKVTGLANRTSYVIGRDGKVKLAFTDMNPNDHVKQTLQAVRALRRR